MPCSRYPRKWRLRDHDRPSPSRPRWSNADAAAAAGERGRAARRLGSTLAEAVRKAWDLAVPDGVVLLAPACSSFDMFADYAERGRHFKAEVMKLVER